jgi:hypothetical protein
MFGVTQFKNTPIALDKRARFGKNDGTICEIRINKGPNREKI